MHDFDVSRAQRHAEKEAEFGDRQFSFRGEVFHVRPNVGYIALRRVAALTEAASGTETFDAIEESVLSMVDPRDDAHERFLALTRDLSDPITFEDLIDMQSWLVAETSGRPPTQPQPSASTPGETGTSSTETSSSEQEEASTT